MVSRRSLEIATAALTGAFGAAILVSSLHAGVGWTSRGVGSGMFPFIAGIIIIAASVYNAARAFASAGPVVLDGQGARKLAAMLVPAVLFVAAIPLSGLHVAAGLYVLGTVAPHRKGSLKVALLLALLTPLALYGIFDRAFQVTLPRGLLGAALGF